MTQKYSKVTGDLIASQAGQLSAARLVAHLYFF